MQDNNPEVSKDVYTLVTDKILDLLAAGTIPWRKPWTEAGLPRNLISKRSYRGINLMLLNSMGFDQNLFLTWKQLKTVGGSVKKGEKGIIVVFQKMIEKQDEKEGEAKVQKKSLLRYYKVFNVGQCKDIPEAFFPKVIKKKNNKPIPKCKKIVEEMPDAPPIKHDGDGAYYLPTVDFINMPPISSFESSEEYYGTLFHELIHSTGHQKRLARKELYDTKKDIEMYSLEELVAEIGSCYLKSETGLPIHDLVNSAAYIHGWLEVLKGDNHMIVKAASKAQQAVEYILKVKEPNEEPEQAVLEVQG